MEEKIKRLMEDNTKNELLEIVEEEGVDVSTNSLKRDIAQSIVESRQEDVEEDEDMVGIKIASTEPVFFSINGEIFSARRERVQRWVDGQVLEVPAEREEEFRNRIRESYPDLELV